jgi:hypothetical protein
MRYTRTIVRASTRLTKRGSGGVPLRASSSARATKLLPRSTFRRALGGGVRARGAEGAPDFMHAEMGSVPAAESFMDSKMGS